MEIFLIILVAAIVVAVLMSRTSREPRSGVPALLNREDYDGAWAEASRAIEREPRRVDMRLYRAEAAKMSGRFEDAISDFREAMEIDPTDPTVREGLALTLTYAGQDLEGARELMEETIQAHPAIQEFQALELAWILLRLGRRDEALRLFHDNAELLRTRFDMDYTDADPQLAETLHLFARLSEEAQESEAARALHERVIAWAPRSIFARWSRERLEALERS